MKGNQRKALMELCILLCIILTLTVGWTVYDKTVDRSGWGEKDGVVFYKDFHGQPVSGWNVIGDDTYYFDNNCAMVTFRSARKVRILADSSMPWTLDGEREEGHWEVYAENLHHAIQLIKKVD